MQNGNLYGDQPIKLFRQEHNKLQELLFKHNSFLNNCN